MIGSGYNGRMEGVQEHQRGEGGAEGEGGKGGGEKKKD